MSCLFYWMQLQWLGKINTADCTQLVLFWEVDHELSSVEFEWSSRVHAGKIRDIDKVDPEYEYDAMRWTPVQVKEWNSRPGDQYPKLQGWWYRSARVTAQKRNAKGWLISSKPAVACGAGRARATISHFWNDSKVVTRTSWLIAALEQCHLFLERYNHWGLSTDGGNCYHTSITQFVMIKWK